jgi:hypothetical protein
MAMHHREKHHVNPFRCIDESVSTSRPDLIIADFLTFGAWDVAEKHKVRQAADLVHLQLVMLLAAGKAAARASPG